MGGGGLFLGVCSALFDKRKILFPKAVSYSGLI